MEIPPEAEEILEELIEQKEANREAMADAFGGPPQGNGNQPPADDDAELDDLPQTLPQNQQTRTALVQWHRRTLKAAKNGKPLDGEFISADIPATLYNSIMAQLKAAKNVDDVNGVFDRVFSVKKNDGDLAAALFAAAAALEAVFPAAGCIEHTPLK